MSELIWQVFKEMRSAYNVDPWSARHEIQRLMREDYGEDVAIIDVIRAENELELKIAGFKP
jgi:hypothetical protein